MKIFSNLYFRYGLFLVAGLLLGRLLFHSNAKSEVSQPSATSTEEKKSEIWTCSMHPQIRMDKFGKCPICAMDLIPLLQSSTSDMDPSTIRFTKEAAQLANVRTSVVSRQQPVKEMHLFGKVQADERLVQSQVAFISGRIEKLLVNFTGETVKKGQALAVVYSPELVTAQQELLEAVKTKQLQPEIYEAAEEKLKQWKLTEKQVLAIENSGKVIAEMEITSTSSGVVISRKVNKGDYISQGTVLYEIVDLSRVWVLFDAYESDLPYLKKGDKIDFSLQALPGKEYSGTIAFIDPVIDPVNRVAKVRVETGNGSGIFKPEMFVNGKVVSRLDSYKDQLVIPRSAVLWTGTRSVVYVKQPGEEPVFKLREVGLGPLLGENYVISDGLSDGEVVVTEGAFSVDAASQLEGKPSMMSQEMGRAEPTAKSVEMNSSQTNLTLLDLATLKEVKFKVSGNCEMCKERIETAAKAIAGVSSAIWNAGDKKLVIKFDQNKTSSDVVEKAVAQSGHDTEKYKAPDDVYSKLPACCLYR